MSTLTFGILTVSDSCYDGKSKDASGPEAQRLVSDPATDTGAILRGRIVSTEIVPDCQSVVSEVLRRWADRENINVIVTTGGTGLSRRDVTPEATRKVIDREVPGIVLAMVSAGLRKTATAMLSRAVCGVRDKTLIVNLPGSPKAVRECLAVVAPAIPHAVALILDCGSKVSDDHKNLGDNDRRSDGRSAKRPHLMNVLADVANRARESPYPMVDLNKAIEMLRTETKNDESLVNGGRKMRVPLNKSHGRILAEEVYSERNLPPFRASIKDGYAVIAEDGAGIRRVSGGIAAGEEPGSITLHRGECARVNTGAPVPEGATAVVQVEDTTAFGQAPAPSGFGTIETTIQVLRQPTVGQDIRKIGVDLALGDFVLGARTFIGPPEMGILASCGINEVPVFRVPVVGVLSTGNELQAAGESPKPGHVYDSNKIMLIATLKECGYDSMDLGIVQDDPDAMIASIENALELVDVLITTGSVSMGDKDMLKPILKGIFEATILFGRVNLKPGKPTTFATCRYAGKKKYFLCLPGNPVSAMVTAHLFAIPLLHNLANNDSTPTLVLAEVTSNYVLDARPEYVRVILKWNGSDVPRAYSTGHQTSSRLLSCRSANAFLTLPAKSWEKVFVKAGERVPAMLIGYENRPS